MTSFLLLIRIYQIKSFAHQAKADPGMKELRVLSNWEK